MYLPPRVVITSVPAAFSVAGAEYADMTLTPFMRA
jgi:hypothetical protein